MTDDEIKTAYESWWETNDNHAFPIWVGAKAAISKFKEKNTPQVTPQVVTEGNASEVRSTDTGEPVAVVGHTYDGTERGGNKPTGKAIFSYKSINTLEIGTKLYTAPPSIEAAIEATKEKVPKGKHHLYNTPKIVPQTPVAWQPIETLKPTVEELDILMGDGSVLCNVITQADGDLWWGGSGTGEKFIDPEYAAVTHWRKHSDTTPPVVPQGEPVAYVETKEVHGHMCSFIYRTDLTKLLPDGSKLYTTPPSVEAAIEATKEEFIEIVRTIGGKFAQEAEAAIRSMK